MEGRDPINPHIQNPISNDHVKLEPVHQQFRLWSSLLRLLRFHTRDVQNGCPCEDQATTKSCFNFLFHMISVCQDYLLNTRI